MARVFVSYASEDRAIVRELVRVVERAGHSVWWDRDIAAGTRYEERIEREVEAADVVLVVWSRASIASPWVRAEAQEGLSRNVLVPARIDDVRPPMAFRAFECAQLIGWPEQENPVELNAVLVGISKAANANGAADEATVVVRDDPTLSQRVANRLADSTFVRRNPTPVPLGVERAISDLLARTLIRSMSATASLRQFAREIAAPLEADHVSFEINGAKHTGVGSPAIGLALLEIATADAGDASVSRRVHELAGTPAAGIVDWLVYVSTPGLTLSLGGQGVCPASDDVVGRLAMLADLGDHLQF